MPTRFVPFVVYIRKSSDSLHRLGAVSKIVLCCPSFEQGGIHEITRNGHEKKFRVSSWIVLPDKIKVADIL
jgi:hypothetical protein